MTRRSSLGPVVSGCAAARRPARLSARQSEVASLIAHGLLNREIGATLHIGERTVESHVEAILRKLGFRRRTQIAIWAARSLVWDSTHSSFIDPPASDSEAK